MTRTPFNALQAAGIAMAIAATRGVAAESGNHVDYLLIRRDQPAQMVEVLEIAARRLVVREAGSEWTSVPRDRCVALLSAGAVIVERRQGWLRLSDGQRFPGQALSGAPRGEGVLAWNQSSWLGRMEVKIDQIESVTFAGAPVPPHGESDVLLLVNGDRVEGFITAIGDPITLELSGDDGRTRVVELALERVAALRMVAPAQAPSGQRVWLADGTVFAARDVLLGEDGFFRVDGVAFCDEPARRIEREGVAAVLFDPKALVPLAALAPRRVDGPAGRYVVPPPRALQDNAPLGVAAVEFRGPLAAQYVLPVGAAHFQADVQLPVLARTIGDCDVVVLDDGHEVFRARLNARHPSASIAVPLSGSILTIEVREGSSGPIQNRVVLNRAAILVAH
jgi:hypothetical protein